VPALLGLMLVTLVLVAGCGALAPGTRPAPDGTITIGCDIPLSGPNAQYGEDYREMIEQAVAAVNDAHLIRGRLATAYADSQALPGPAVTSARKLIEVDSAIALLNGFSSPTKAVAPIANRNQVVEINGGASGPDLAGLGPYVFNDIPLADDQAALITPYLVHTLNLRRWAVLYSSETLGESLLAALRRTVPEQGGEIVLAVQVEATTTTFQSQIAQLNAAHPDVIYVANTSGGAMPALVNELRASGSRTQVASYAGADIPQVVSDPNAEGVLFTAQRLNLAAPNRWTAQFVRDFRRNHPNTGPSSLQINYYNAVLVIAEAIANLQRTGTEVTSQNVARRIARDEFDVVGDTMKFTSRGTLEHPSIEIRRLTNGREQPVPPSGL
jgi:branched-chain amino acid transport system substrate-binding protein